MKKLISMAVALLMAMSLMLVVVGCGNKDDDSGKQYSSGDTFAGALSKESFSSDEKAVKAFLSTEISGEAVKAELVDFKKTGELTQTEIEELDTGDVLDEGDKIESVDVVEVTYSTSAIASTAAAPEDDYCVFTVYILEITPHGNTLHEFRYYVPKAANGDVLTRSYFEDVLNSSKYVNCTQEYKNESKISIMGLTMDVKQDYTIKVAGNKASLRMHMINPMGEGPNDYLNVLGYFEYADEQFKVWMSQDNGTSYKAAPSTSFAAQGVVDMESFATMCLPKLDYSFFEKTDFGFKIQDGFVGEYIGKTLGSMGFDTEVEAELLFYVEEGRIVKMVSNSSYTISGANYTVKEELIYGSFGSTTVTTPDLID